MTFSWRKDPDNLPVIVGNNLVRFTIEELESGESQTPKVTYAADLNIDAGTDIPSFKTALNAIFKAKKDEILAGRAKRVRLAELVANIADSDFDSFEGYINA